MQSKVKEGPPPSYQMLELRREVDLMPPQSLGILVFINQMHYHTIVKILLDLIYFTGIVFAIYSSFKLRACPFNPFCKFHLTNKVQE